MITREDNELSGHIELDKTRAYPAVQKSAAEEKKKEVLRDSHKGTSNTKRTCYGSFPFRKNPEPHKLGSHRDSSIRIFLGERNLLNSVSLNMD